MGFSSDYVPVTADSLPNIINAIEFSEAFISTLNSKSWAKSNTYLNGTVQTIRSFRHGNQWYGRISYHKEFPFEVFRATLLLNHTVNEEQYIKSLESHKKFKTDPRKFGWEGYVTRYSTPWPAKQRQFAEWVLSVDSPSAKNCFYNISIPAKVDEDELYSGPVLGAYTSIERVRFDIEKNAVEWVMLVTSDACGLIPKWVQHLSFPRIITEDVASYIPWAQEKYKNGDLNDILENQKKVLLQMYAEIDATESNDSIATNDKIKPSTITAPSSPDGSPKLDPTTEKESKDVSKDDATNLEDTKLDTVNSEISSIYPKVIRIISGHSTHDEK